jgi:hypothetical protein
MTTRRFGSATQKSTRSPGSEKASRHRQTGLRRKQAPGSAPYGTSLPESLHDAIEIERGNLSQAESLLGCLVISMEYEYETDSVNAPYYPDVARLARDLVRQSINGLDSLSLQKSLLRDKVKEESGLDRGCSIAAEYDSSGTNASAHARWTEAGDTYLFSTMLQ